MNGQENNLFMSVMQGLTIVIVGVSLHDSPSPLK
jgi:hypothetical protein